MLKPMDANLLNIEFHDAQLRVRTHTHQHYNNNCFEFHVYNFDYVLNGG
jgi:hypothetical protein